MSRFDNLSDDELAMMVGEFCEENPLYNSEHILINKRSVDSPNHYIYKKGEEVVRGRCRIILELEAILSHDHTTCADRRIKYKPNRYNHNGETRITISVACSGSTMVFGSRAQDDHITLVTIWPFGQRDIGRMPPISLMDPEYSSIDEYIKNKFSR